jgi:diguanylate cyclase
LALPIEAVLGLIVVAVVANLLLMGALIAPTFASRMRRGKGGANAPDSIDPRATEAAMVTGLVVDPTDPEVRPGYDRVVRIVSWVFLMATATIVAVTGLWPTTQPAILVLLALVGLFIVVVHDLLPSDALGPGRFVVEGSVALTAATFLVALTGGVQSPFFFTFPLIVAGAALVVSSTVTVGLTVVAALGFLTGVLAGSPPGTMGPMAEAVIGVDLTALILLAYVAMVIAREQRRTRDAAIRLSTIDPLTGLFNRTFFFAAIEREITRSARSGRGFCLLMMDLDELKIVNDRYGHFYGDRVLRGLGDVVTAGVRRLDTAARYGGDEFVVLQPAAIAVRGRREFPRRRPDRRRTDDQRRRRDVRLEARRQGPGHGHPDAHRTGLSRRPGPGPMGPV